MSWKSNGMSWNLVLKIVWEPCVILHAHPVRGESHNQCNTTGEVATGATSISLPMMVVLVPFDISASCACRVVTVVAIGYECFQF